MAGEFDHVTPTDDQRAAMGEIRERFAQLQELIEEKAPPTRSRSLAVTNLEQSAMWANKAITHGR